jgi:hypothetical protein
MFPLLAASNSETTIDIGLSLVELIFGTDAVATYTKRVW